MIRRLSFVLAVATVVIPLAGCSDLGAPLEPRPQSQLSATLLDFGTLAVSQSATRSVTISNSGTGPLLGSARLSCAEYAIQSGGGPFSIPPGASHTIVVQFTPGAAGAYPCALDLGPDCPSVAITGSGALQAPGARCVVLVDSIPFGPVAVGRASNQSFEVLNAGTAPLLLDVVSSCGDFEVITGGGASQVPAGGSIDVVVAFHPTSGGRSSCAIALGPDCPDVPVSGQGTTVSFANDIQPILTARCTDGCHQHPYFTDPETNDTYYSLVTQWQNLPYGYVRPFDPANSWVYQYIVIGYMPADGSTVPPEDLDKIRQWILEGAIKN
ncbi:MAG TPA: choice-of-anchor D domain-containing protein [Candidatus Eisenbacteria bacterium]